MSYESEKLGHVSRLKKVNAFELLKEKYGERYSAYREEWKQAGVMQIKTEKPLQLSVELSSFCNLLCKMCYRNKWAESNKSFLSLELVDKIIAQAKSIEGGIPGIWLGLMNEGLLHPEIETIIRKFADVEAMDYWIVTNGTLLTESISNAMIDAQVTMFSVSLDAATQETYKNIRGADLAKVTRNIMKFIELREKRNSLFPRLRVSFVEMSDNLHEKQLFTEQWESVADIIDYQKMADTSVKDDNKRIEALNKSQFKCADPFSRILVRYDGELWPCCGHYTSKNKMNLSETSLMEFWNSEQMEKLRESMRTRKFLSSCEYCDALLTF